jgi:hypothetical protein
LGALAAAAAAWPALSLSLSLIFFNLLSYITFPCMNAFCIHLLSPIEQVELYTFKHKKKWKILEKSYAYYSTVFFIWNLVCISMSVMYTVL